MAENDLTVTGEESLARLLWPELLGVGIALVLVALSIFLGLWWPLLLIGVEALVWFSVLRR